MLTTVPKAKAEETAEEGEKAEVPKNHPNRNKSPYCKNSRKRTELGSCVLTRNTKGGAESTSKKAVHTSTQTQRSTPTRQQLRKTKHPRNHKYPHPRGVGNL